MAEAKFNHRLEEAAQTYFENSGLITDPKSRGPLVSFLPKAIIEGLTPIEVFTIWRHGIDIDYLTASVVTRNLSSLIPDFFLRSQMAYFAQKALGQTDLDILRHQLAELLGMDWERLESLSPLEERKRNLEKLKEMLLAHSD